MEHTFDIDIANKYGVDCAIIIRNLCFWIHKNQANKKNFHDGYYWTYNSERAFSEIFPYWSRRQIQTIINKLKKNSIIEVGNYNKKKYDRTNWYTVIDKEILKKYKINHAATQENSPLNNSVQSIEQNGAMSENDSCNDENVKKEHSISESTTIEQNGAMHSTKMFNGLHENVQPIPDVNTDNKTNNKQESDPPKNNFGSESVLLTENEHQKLIEGYGEEDTKRLIEILDNYKLSNGKKYKSDYRTILNWVVDRLKEEKFKDEKYKFKNKNKPVQSTNHDKRQYSDEEWKEIESKNIKYL